MYLEMRDAIFLTIPVQILRFNAISLRLIQHKFQNVFVLGLRIHKEEKLHTLKINRCVGEQETIKKAKKKKKKNSDTQTIGWKMEFMSFVSIPV